MSTTDAYFAGLIDGEGTIGLLDPGKGGFLQPFISMSSTTPVLTDWVKANYGGVLSKRKARKSTHQDAIVWKLQGRKALATLERALPYLLEEHKRAKAQLLVDRYDAVTVRNGQYNSEQLREKLRLQEEFKAIGCSRGCLTSFE